MLALLLLAPAFTDMLTRRATHSAVAKHGGAGSIPAGPLFRRVMRDLGTDLSRRNSDRLLALYAKNVSHITVDEIASIIDLSHSASPSKHFWLRVDPDDNGIRETRPKWNRFAQAGLGSADRIAHYAVGLAARCEFTKREHTTKQSNPQGMMPRCRSSFTARRERELGAVVAAGQRR